MGVTAAAIIGAVGALGSAGMNMYSASKSRGGADIGGAMKHLRGFDLGDVPDAALYDPVNFDQEQLAAILGNLNNLPDMNRLAAQTNRFISDDAIKRAQKMIPGYMSSMRMLGANTDDLLSGRLPFEDVLDIIGDRNTLTGALGTPGTGGAATLKDLGLSRLGAMREGAGLLGEMVNMAETISPRSSYLNPKEMFVSPLDRIRLGMEQNALLQQSQQNANNLAAQADPNDLAAAQLITGGALLNPGGGAGVNNAAWIPAATSASQQLVGGVNTWGKRQGYWGTPERTPGGGYYSERAMWKDAPNAYGSSFDSEIGYLPTPKVVSYPKAA